MDSTKGYKKVNPSETPFPTNQQHHRRKIITISLALSLTLLFLCSLFAILTHKSASNNSTQTQITSSNSLHTVCSVTQYPKTCFSSISPLNTLPLNNNPLHFLNLSILASTIQVSKLRNVSGLEPALKDCAELFNESISQLEKSSAALINVGHSEKVMTEMRISDLQTWISAAMTDQETCIDGLEEMGSTAVDEFKVKVKISHECMSNSLAILNNIRGLFDKFGFKMP